MDLLFGDIRAGGAAVLTDHVEQVTGRPALSLEDFARDHADLFEA